MSRKNISLPEAINDRAKELIAARGFSGLSDLIAVLIREEYERRGSPALLKESPSAYAAGEVGSTPAIPAPLGFEKEVAEVERRSPKPKRGPK
jgi:hypothetical protein